MSRSDFVSTLFPPVEIDPLAEAAYGTNQTLHRHHIKLLVERAAEPFERLAQEKTGDCLIELQNWLAWEYLNRPTSCSVTQLPPKDQHPLTNIDQFKLPGVCFNTDFGFYIENVGIFEGDLNLRCNQRSLFNFLTCKHMIERGSTSISVADFVKRAAIFAQITLPEPVLTISPVIIASIGSNNHSSRIEMHHQLGALFHESEETREYLKTLYTALLNVIYEASNSSKKRITAIFLLAFLVGSNPLLINGKGGAFQADFLLQHLLTSIGEPPVRKNFLGLTEIELLLLLAQDNPIAWEQPEKEYRAAIKGDSNPLFHPVSADIKSLIPMVSADLVLTGRSKLITANCQTAYACYRASIRTCLLDHKAETLPTRFQFFQSMQQEKASSVTLPEIFFEKNLPFLKASAEMVKKLNDYVQNCRTHTNDALLATMLIAEIDALTEHPENADTVIALLKNHFRISSDTQYSLCIEKCAALCDVDLHSPGQSLNASF